jgi:hypothetical protein
MRSPLKTPSKATIAVLPSLLDFVYIANMFSFKSAVASATLLSFVKADFNIWLRQTCTPDSASSNTETCGFTWATAPAHVSQYCQGKVQTALGGLDDHPCDKWMTTDTGGTTIIHNCANNYGATPGSYYGDVLHYNADGTSTAGTCYTWNDAAAQDIIVRCSALPELWVGKITCTINGVYGLP